MIKAVFDTNTILSGILWSGNESRLINLVETEQLKLYISQEILKELERILEYNRIQEIPERNLLAIRKYGYTF